MESQNAELRGRLLGAKLRGLVGDHLGRPVEGEPAPLPAGAGLVVDGEAWIIVEGAGERALGTALAWAVRRHAVALHLVVDEATGPLARRAAQFEFPISVWYPQDRTILPVVAEHVLPHPDASDEHLAFAELIERGGAEVNVEYGVVTGEVRGLEVCRVVDEATTGRLVELGDVDLAAIGDEPGVRLEVGVGANDREAFQIIHGNVPTLDALRAVVGSVRAHRSVDAVQHPLNRMAPERFLRWQAIEEPDRIGLHRLVAAPPPVPRPSMKHQAPAVARGVDGDGEHVVIFTSGVDVDVVPFALDAHTTLRAWDPTADFRSIRVAGRRNDLVTLTRDVAALSAVRVELTPVD